MARRDTVNIRVNKDFAMLLRRLERSRSRKLGVTVGLPAVTRDLSQPPMEEVFKMQLSKKRRNLFKL